MGGENWYYNIGGNVYKQCFVLNEFNNTRDKRTFIITHFEDRGNEFYSLFRIFIRIHVYILQKNFFFFLLYLLYMYFQRPIFSKNLLYPNTFIISYPKNIFPTPRVVPPRFVREKIG